MSEDILVEGEERLARRYAEPHPEDMSDKPSRPESVYEALDASRQPSSAKSSVASCTSVPGRARFTAGRPSGSAID